MAEITEIVESLVTPIVDEKGYELVDVEYIKEKSTRYLRIYVNKSGGIDIEEVAQVSEQLSEKLDELNPDPFPEPYMLEVSSPGVERPIKKKKKTGKVRLVNTSMLVYTVLLKAKKYTKVFFD